MAVARFLLGARWRVGRGRMTSLNGRNSLQARCRLARVGALAKQMDYLGRGSAAEDRTQGVVFNAEEDLTREELAALRREMVGDRHHFRFIVSPEAGDVDHFMLHIYASIAEQERKMISERVRAATLIAKNQGRKFGLQLRPKSWQRKVSALGRAALIQEANDRAQAYRVYIEWALKQPGREGRPISFRGAAIRLNESNVETPLGGIWRGHHIPRMARRG